MNMKTISAMIGMMTVLSGCVAKPEPVNPVPFSDKNSYALNIANQTVLTRNDSPLKDFTHDEKDEITLAIGRAQSGGDTSLLFGGLKLLTLDLTGVIDVAGGAVSNLAERSHPVGSFHWLIEVDATKLSTEEDAQDYILETLEKVTVEQLSKYGSVSKNSVLEGFFTYVINHNGKEYSFGGLQRERSKQGLLIKRNYQISSNRNIDTYTYGISKSDHLLNNYLVGPVSPLSFAVESKNDVDLTEFYKELTSKLPKGFYLYMPSLPQYKVDKITYTDYAEVLPAIYTQGKKYEFIKPE
ncbi:hypothetical protein [Vibrio aestuarianus]|uniref:hypothetical protein n=1 Tax=Vibrio aestuarianus TaxID=28171 RepID=UPI00237C5887|nr:hypothetical protein [Vibrio aestuarianus]MDE1237837.1 hypothetical protein [Vibrio aestuarianus]